jgi:hypothetical protein
VAEPDHVHIDVLDALRGLDQHDHHRARVCLSDLVGLSAALIVVVRRNIERGAAAACRWVSRAVNDCLRLLGRLDHGHHDTKRTDVERPRDVVIVARWDARERHKIEPAAESELCLHCLEADARVVHVVENEFGACLAADRRVAGREELDRSRTRQGPLLDP